MKILSALLLVLLTTSCSSSYTPGEQMLAFKKDMTPEQAEQQLQKMIWNPGKPSGICGARGFWFDKESDMYVHKEGISLLAHKRGKEIKKLKQAFDDTVVFEKQYYKYEFEFNKLSAVLIYDDPLLLPVFPDCNVKDIHDEYYIIDLFGDELNNLKFIVLTGDFDKTMAALSIMLPDIETTLK